jgi:SAM-dependent methyltransferase
MTEQEIKDELRRLGPFHHDVELPFGLRTHVPELSRREVERTRLPNLVKHVWPSLLETCGGSLRAQRVLDVACNCGGFSIEAIKSGADYVLGIDVVDRYLEQAKFIKDALELKEVEFKKLAVEDLDEATIGSFDVTFCFGILYHLENPVLAMRKLSAVTRRVMVVDTNVFRPRFMRKPVWYMNFPRPTTPQSPVISTSLWRTAGVCQLMPNAQAVNDLLKLVGFSKVRQLKPTAKKLEKRYYKGRRVTFIATRD